MAWLGGVWLVPVCLGRRGMASPGKVRQGAMQRGLAGLAGRGMAGRGWAWCVLAGLARLDGAWQGQARAGMARCG